MSVQNLPSSMGFTFLLKVKSIKLYSKLSWCCRKALLEDCAIPFEPQDNDYLIPDEFGYVSYSKKKG